MIRVVLFPARPSSVSRFGRWAIDSHTYRNPLDESRWTRAYFPSTAIPGEVLSAGKPRCPGPIPDRPESEKSLPAESSTVAPESAVTAVTRAFPMRIPSAVTSPNGKSKCREFGRFRSDGRSVPDSAGGRSGRQMPKLGPRRYPEVGPQV